MMLVRRLTLDQMNLLDLGNTIQVAGVIYADGKDIRNICGDIGGIGDAIGLNIVKALESGHGFIDLAKADERPKKRKT